LPELRSRFPASPAGRAAGAGDWNVRCPACQEAVQPAPTNEDKTLYPTSIYAINKRDHEEMALAFGHAYELPAVAMRFFNIYGSRQALSNPYTGVAAIFSGRMLDGQVPRLYEDGLQQRDFVHVGDIVRACCLAMNKSAADYQVLNVGTGRPISVLQVAQILARDLEFNGPPEITRKYRDVQGPRPGRRGDPSGDSRPGPLIESGLQQKFGGAPTRVCRTARCRRTMLSCKRCATPSVMPPSRK
jgi:nucleoside-diphosphate-sugar epimerase